LQIGTLDTGHAGLYRMLVCHYPLITLVIDGVRFLNAGREQKSEGVDYRETMKTLCHRKVLNHTACHIA
jgi:hypothetical protein